MERGNVSIQTAHVYQRTYFCPSGSKSAVLPNVPLPCRVCVQQTKLWVMMRRREVSRQVNNIRPSKEEREKKHTQQWEPKGKQHAHRGIARKSVFFSELKNRKRKRPGTVGDKNLLACCGYRSAAAVLPHNSTGWNGHLSCAHSEEQRKNKREKNTSKKKRDTKSINLSRANQSPKIYRRVRR